MEGSDLVGVKFVQTFVYRSEKSKFTHGVSGFKLVGSKALKVNFVYDLGEFCLNGWENTHYPNGFYNYNTSPNENARDYSFYIDVVIAFLKGYFLAFELLHLQKNCRLF